MDDLISRQQAIEAVKFYETLCDPYPRVIESLEKLPTIEPRKGRWIQDVAYYDEEGCPCIVTRCDQCGNVHPVDNFCPNCGADMRRGGAE